MVQITVTYLSTALSRNPSDYSLCLVGSGCDFQNAIFIIVFLIGNFRFSPGSAFTWISQDLTHDKTTLLQLMGWCHQWQQAITPDITWTNVEPNLCHYMALLVSKNLITWGRLHSKGNHCPHGIYTQLSEIHSFGVKLIAGLCQLIWRVTPGDYTNIQNLSIGKMTSLYWTVSQ